MLIAALATDRRTGEAGVGIARTAEETRGASAIASSRGVLFVNSIVRPTTMDSLESWLYAQRTTTGILRALRSELLYDPIVTQIGFVSPSGKTEHETGWNMARVAKAKTSIQGVMAVGHGLKDEDVLRAARSKLLNEPGSLVRRINAALTSALEAQGYGGSEEREIKIAVSGGSAQRITLAWGHQASA